MKKAHGLWFGLGNYECGKIQGSLSSKYECKQCGVFCSYNEIVPGCTQVVFPIIIGLLSGTILGVLMMVIIHHKLNKLLGIIHKYMVVRRHTRKDDRIFKVSKLIKNNTRDDVEMNLGSITSVKGKDIIQERRNAKLAEFEHEYIEPNDMHDLSVNRFKSNTNKSEPKIEMTYTDTTTGCQQEDKPANETSDVSTVTNLRRQVKIEHDALYTNNLPASNTSPSLKKVMLTGILLSSATMAKACDQTLLIKSDGNVCDLTECKNIKMYNFPILTGQSICFKDVEGEILHIEIHQSYYRSRYMLMYYTSDFIIDTESYYECKGRN